MLYGVFVVRNCNVKYTFFFKILWKCLANFFCFIFTFGYSPFSLLFLAVSELEPKNEDIINKKRPSLLSAFTRKCLFSEKLMRTPSTHTFSLRGG